MQNQARHDTTGQHLGKKMSSGFEKYCVWSRIHP